MANYKLTSSFVLLTLFRVANSELVDILEEVWPTTTTGIDGTASGDLGEIYFTDLPGIPSKLDFQSTPFSVNLYL